MSKKTPKGKIPSLIGGANGRPHVAAVKKLSHCYRCKDDLLAGTTCIEIPKLGGAYKSDRRVCDACFGLILDQTASDLEAARQLRGAP